MDVVYTGKWQYEIQEQKEVPIWYTGPFRALTIYDWLTDWPILSGDSVAPISEIRTSAMIL
jgi:hypothetical protein